MFTYFLYQLYIHSISSMHTSYIHVIICGCMLCTFYIHFIYMCIYICKHLIYTLYTFHILCIDFLYKFHIFLYTFWSCSGHVPDKFWGSKLRFFPKSFGDLWAILWHHRRCLRRGGKNYFVCFFKKMKSVQKDAESSYEPMALIRIFIFFFSSRFMHFLIFYIFQYFPLLSFFGALKGP